MPAIYWPCGTVGRDNDYRGNKLWRAVGHVSACRRTVRIPARSVWAARWLPVRLDVLYSDPDRHHRRRRRGVRQVHILPGASRGEGNILLDAGFFRITAAQTLSILVIVLLTFINSRGVKNGVFMTDAAYHYQDRILIRAHHLRFLVRGRQRRLECQLEERLVAHQPGVARR